VGAERGLGALAAPALALMIIYYAKIIAWLLLLMLLLEVLADRSGPEPVGRRAASFTEAYHYTDGLTVTVTKITHGTLTEIPQTDDPLTKLRDPYTVLTVVINNGSSHTVEVWFVGRVSYGPDRRRAGRFATRAMSDLTSVQLVAPGETSYPYELGFLIPTAARDDIVFELNIDGREHQPAIFEGSTTTRAGPR
jgi:hypothetical protein